ncbi:unnamed protein product [Linum trigynum]|uniref:Uncharacterized protein n=1 Tax=Linum trigynum TaxID=586398 RepID=A0AAV2GLT5_9ROSI
MPIKSRLGGEKKTQGQTVAKFLVDVHFREPYSLAVKASNDKSKGIAIMKGQIMILEFIVVICVGFIKFTGFGQSLLLYVRVVQRSSSYGIKLMRNVVPIMKDIIEPRTRPIMHFGLFQMSIQDILT